jgi:hypothetical protein
MPHRAEYKDRFRCWVCDFRGDHIDLLRHFHPRETYPQLLERLKGYEEDYDRQVRDGTLPSDLADLNPYGGSGSVSVGSARGGSFSFPGERGVLKPVQEPARVPDVRALGRAWADLSQDERALLVAAGLILEERGGTAPDGLTAYCLAFVRWVGKTDWAHLVGCWDQDCEARICRAAMGLPPLTPQELKAQRRAKEAAEAARLDAERRWMLALQAQERQRALKRLAERNGRQG